MDEDFKPTRDAVNYYSDVIVESFEQRYDDRTFEEQFEMMERLMEAFRYNHKLNIRGNATSGFRSRRALRLLKDMVTGYRNFSLAKEKEDIASKKTKRDQA